MPDIGCANRSWLCILVWHSLCIPSWIQDGMLTNGAHNTRRRCANRRCRSRQCPSGRQRLDPAPGRALARQCHRAARRPAICRQGQHGRGRPADDRGLSSLRLPADGACQSGAAPARCRCNAGRQDQPRPIRMWSQWLAFSLWAGAQRIRCALCVRRLQFRFGLCGGHRAGRFRAGHRHRGFGSGAGRSQQHRRTQAEQGLDQHQRRGSGGAKRRLCLDLRDRRARGGAGVAGGGGP